ARILAAVWIAAAAMYLVVTELALTGLQARGAAIDIALIALWLTLRDREFRGWLWRTTLGQWSAIDRDTVRDPAEAGKYSRTVLIVLVVVAVSLTLQEYLGDRVYFERWFPAHGKPDKYYELESFAWWSGWRVTGYVVMPVVVLLAMRWGHHVMR